MKSRSTIKRWIIELKDEGPLPERLCLYRQGMEAALNSVIYNWTSPVQFLRLAKRFKRARRASQETK